MKERPVLTPEVHARINGLHSDPRFKSEIDRGIHSAIIVAEDVERHTQGQIALSTPKQHAQLIDNYLDAMCVGLRNGVSAIEMGLWIQSCISFLSLVKNGRERTE